MRLLLITIFIISSFFSSGLRAQEEGYAEEELTETPEGVATPANGKLAKIAARLQLTAEQLPQVEAILLEFSATPPPTTPEAKKARRRALRARVAQILTPEQRALLNQQKTSRRNPNSPETTKRHWLDAIIEDIATPLLNQRRDGKTPPD